MERLPHPAVVWTANLLVPGAGLVLLGRVLAGTAVALLWAAAMAGLLVGLMVWPDAMEAGPVASLGVLAALLYATGQALAFARARTARRLAEDTSRDAAFLEVLTATLQGRTGEAEAACRALLRQDPDDVEATLHLGVLAARAGWPAAARRYLRRARFLDDAGRWDFQIGRELAALKTRAVSEPRA